MRVQEEDLSAVLPELRLLAEEHWREVDWGRAGTYNPNWYLMLEQNAAKQLRILTLRTNAGEYIGHLALYITPSIQTGRLNAMHNAFVVRKDWRTGRGAFLLLEAADALYQELGVEEVYASHPDNPSLHRLLDRFGHRKIGSVYYKSGGQE